MWQGRLKNGILVAIKCLRLHTILVGDKKGMKVRISTDCCDERRLSPVSPNSQYNVNL